MGRRAPRKASARYTACGTVEQETAAEDRQIGRILVERGLISEAALAECVKDQRELARTRGPQAPRLGEVLIERGLVPAERIHEALAQQKRRILYCPTCEIHVNVALETDKGVVLRCGNCQTPLCDPPSPQHVHVVDSSTMLIIRDTMPDEVQSSAADPAKKFGRYVLVSEVGRGGIGIVYKAWDTYLGRYVAIKLPERATASVNMSLLQEARSSVALRHPNIVNVYDIGRIEHKFYISMEFLEGHTLADEFQEARAGGEPPFYRMPARYVRIIRDVACGLQYAHTQKEPVIHCDVKPSNVFLDLTDRPVLLDFGLARHLKSATADDEQAISGTPSYMSPEQAAGHPEDIDARTDVYGLGALMYELLTGRPPFVGSVISTLKHAIADMPARPSALKTFGGRPIPAELEELCLQCLEKERSMRPRTADEVADTLDYVVQVLEEAPAPAAPTPPSAPAKPEPRPQPRTEPPRAASAAPAPVKPGALVPAAEGWALVKSSPERAKEARAWLATAYWRPVYVCMRRQGLEPELALPLAKVAFEYSADARTLRESLRHAIDNVSSDVAPSEPLLADTSGADADLPLLADEPGQAFEQAWLAELVRRALGTFYADCMRDGRSDLYDLLSTRLGWARPSRGEGDREERRAQGRFRRTLRRTVAGTVGLAAEVDAELAAVAGTAVPPGPETCPRCGLACATRVAEQVYSGFCPRCLLRLALEPEPPLEQVGPYEIVAQVGADRLGEVYRARQPGGDNVLLITLADPAMVARARDAMKLSQPGIVAIYDAGTADALPYVVTQLIEGPTLEQAAPFPREQAVQIARVIAEAVAAAHDAGLAHGALGVEHVRFDREQRPFVSGFGFVPDSPAARAADTAALATIFDACLGKPSRGQPAKSPREFMAGLGPQMQSSQKIPAYRKTGSSTVQPAYVAAAPKAEADAAEEETPGARRALMILGGLALVALLAIGGFVVRGVLLAPSSGGGGAVPTPTSDGGSARERALRDLAAARETLAGEGDVTAALKAAEGYARQHPDDVEGHVVAARGALRTLDLAAAVAHAKRAIALDAAASPAWRVLAFIAMERGETTAARDAFAKASLSWSCRVPRHAEDESDELIASALELYLKGDKAGAQRVLADAIRRRETPEGYRWSGVVLDDPGASFRWQARALQLRADYAPALIERGRSNAAQGAHADAVADFTDALKAMPRAYPALLGRGLSLAEVGRGDEAEKALGQALAVRDDILARLARAAVRTAAGQWEGALEDATAAATLDPHLAAAHFERGRALWKLKRPEEADVAFQRALDKDPRLKAKIAAVKREKP